MIQRQQRQQNKVVGYLKTDGMKNLVYSKTSFSKLQAGNEVGKVISKLYSAFLLMNPNNTIQTKERWEADISLDTYRDLQGAHQMTNANI